MYICIYMYIYRTLCVQKAEKVCVLRRSEGCLHVSLPSEIAMCVCTYAHIHACMYSCTHVYAPPTHHSTHAQTYIHTHTDTHTHTRA